MAKAKQVGTPITYEHFFGFLACIFVMFIIWSALGYWFAPADPNVIKSISCYNLDGTGPIENCRVRIECHDKANTNSENSKVTCPIWPN